jgi:hypothetical protein
MKEREREREDIGLKVDGKREKREREKETERERGMLCSMSFADHYYSLCLKADILRKRESQREECFAPCFFLISASL